MSAASPQRICTRLPSAALLLQTIGQDLFGEFTCLSPCFGGYECLYQSAYLGPCDSLDSRWLYDNSTQHLRQLVQPDICLTMCPTQVGTNLQLESQLTEKLVPAWSLLAVVNGLPAPLGSCRNHAAVC